MPLHCDEMRDDVTTLLRGFTSAEVAWLLFGTLEWLLWLAKVILGVGVDVRSFV